MIPAVPSACLACNQDQAVIYPSGYGPGRFVFVMLEIGTVTTPKSKRDEITRSIAAYEKKIGQAKADLAHINAATRIFEIGGDMSALPCSEKSVIIDSFVPDLPVNLAEIQMA